MTKNVRFHTLHTRNKQNINILHFAFCIINDQYIKKCFNLFLNHHFHSDIIIHLIKSVISFRYDYFYFVVTLFRNLSAPTWWCMVYGGVFFFILVYPSLNLHISFPVWELKKQITMNSNVDLAVHSSKSWNYSYWNLII